uniref:ZP domain-containing protein n=1 Tax=Stomoxys calcitrans TaxID=35570 RepID=A0A1I8PXU4_STOCA
MFIKSNVFLIAGVLCGVLLTVCEAKKEHQKQQQQQQQQQEVWEQDLSDTFKIEGSDQGIQKVNLKCGSDSMHVVLETEKPFTGVMYTRGSFYKQTAPCFVKPSANEGEKSLEMNFSLDECQTTKDGELYSNIVVIQNDPELITPGDSAFSLECDFRQPRNINVEASMQARDRNSTAKPITANATTTTTTTTTTLKPDI